MLFNSYEFLFIFLPATLVGFFALFVFASFTLLRFDIRRQTYSVSLTEIPLLLALFFLPPLGVLLTRVLAALLVQVYRKVALNRLAEIRTAALWARARAEEGRRVSEARFRAIFAGAAIGMSATL